MKKEPVISIGTVEMPLNDFVVSRNAILGITKSGKTFCAKGEAEQLMELGVPIIVFDAIGMWRFLKVPSGKPGGKGFPIVVAGGAQPDLPLTPSTAPQIVRAAIAQNISLVIDLYDPKLSKADWRRIVQDCFRILLFENKGLRHIFLEEAAEYVPQKVTDGQTYAEVEKLARMGGNASLGITFINPRAQELNKAVLELCDNIVLLRQRGTHAIDSLEKQMDKLSPDMAKEVALTMPNMTQGDCWVFKENGDKPTRTRSSLIKSFHPDRRNPEGNKTTLAAVNTDEFVAKLSGTLGKVIEEAKAKDPVELKRKLALAEKELEKLKLDLSRNLEMKVASVAAKVEIKEVTVLTKKEHATLDSVASSLVEISESLAKEVRTVHGVLIEATKKFTAHQSENRLSHHSVVTASRPVIAPKRFSPVETRLVPPIRLSQSAATNENGTLPKGPARVLACLIQFPNGVDGNQITVLTGYTRRTRNSYIQVLRECGYSDRAGELHVATDAGRAALPDAQPLPTGEELQNYWLQKLPQGERRCFESLLAAYPKPISKETISEQTGYTRRTRASYLYALRAKELFTEPTRGEVRAADQLFQ